MRVATLVMLSVETYQRLQNVPRGNRSALIEELLEYYFDKGKRAAYTEEEIAKRSREMALLEFGLSPNRVDLPGDWSKEQIDAIQSAREKYREQLRKAHSS